jgi:hypothetical protein
MSIFNLRLNLTRKKGCTDLLSVEMFCSYSAVCVVVNDAEDVK